MSRHAPTSTSPKIPKSARIAIVAARFNAEIVDALLADCVARLKEIGITSNRLTIHRVPGAFELPLAAKVICQTRRYAAVIALGAVIRGETPHFDIVANNCAAGLRQVSLEFSLPVIFGVLTTENEKQAWARTRGPHSRTGANSADAAVEMIATLATITPPVAAVRGR